MREIELRAWQKDNGIGKPQMIYDIKPLNTLTNSNEEDNLIFMLYIGLRDKNNKKIFEADIMQFFKAKEQGWDNLSQGIVKYDLSQTAFIIDNDWENKKLGRIYESFEVIGNIYENPELLEKK